MAYFHAANPDALPAHAEPEQAAQILSLGYLSPPTSRPSSQTNVIPRKPSPTSVNFNAPPRPDSRPQTPHGANNVSARYNQTLPMAGNFQKPTGRREPSYGQIQGQSQGRVVRDDYAPPMRLHDDQYFPSAPTPQPVRLSPPRLPGAFPQRPHSRTASDEQIYRRPDAQFPAPARVSPPSQPQVFPPRPGSRTTSQEHAYRRSDSHIPTRLTPPSQGQPFQQPTSQDQIVQRTYSPAPARSSPPSQDRPSPHGHTQGQGLSQLFQKAHGTSTALAPRPQPPNNNSSPRPSDADLFAIFRAVDRDGSGLLSEQELNVALVNSDYTNFDFRTIALMVGMFDKDRKGRLSFEEFQRLWDFLGQWRRNFDDYDVDRNGRISLDEYIHAVRRLGYSLPDNLVTDMFERYDTHRKGELSFDVFVRSVIKLRTITTVFKRYDLDRDGVITITYEDFVMEMLRESSN